jgi:hypothetical protein
MWKLIVLFYSMAQLLLDYIALTWLTIIWKILGQIEIWAVVGEIEEMGCIGINEVVLIRYLKLGLKGCRI